jgi:hypothetical protein
MIKFFFKALVHLVLLVSTLVVSALLVLRFQPQFLLHQLPSLSGYEVNAPDLSVKLSPLRIQTERATVISMASEQTIADIRALDVSLDWLALLGKNPLYIKADLGETDVYLDKLPAGEESPTEGLPARLNLSPLFAIEQANVKALRLHNADAPTQHLQLALNNKSDARQALELLWRLGEKSLALKGELALRETPTRSELSVLLDPLDLQPLMATSDGEQLAATEDPAADTSEAESAGAITKSMDWSWLAMLDRWGIKLMLKSLLMPDVQLEQLEADVAFQEKVIKISNLKSLIKAKHNDVNLHIPVSLKGQAIAKAWQTKAADLALDIVLDAATHKLSVLGDVNVDGLAGNDAVLKVALADDEVLKTLLAEAYSAAAPYLPLTLDAKLSTDTYSVDIAQLDLQAGQSDLSGSLSAGYKDPVITVKGNLTSTALYLAQQTETADEEAEEKEKPKEEADKPKADKLIPSEAIDWAWISNADIDLQLAVASLWLNKAEFKEFSAKLGAGGDTVALNPFKATFGGGGFDGTVAVQHLAEEAKLDIAYKMNGVQLSAFGFIPQEQLSGGEIDVDIALTGQGASPAAIAASLDGAIIASVQKATIMNDSIELVGSDLLMETLNKINPFAKSDPTTELVCGLAWFQAEDGVLDIQPPLLMETSKMRIVGNGKIDLNDESLDIGITPEAKGGITLNVGSIVKFLKLGGTLANPAPGVDAGGLLKSGAAIGATLSTGGLSIVAESLVKQVANNGNACENAWQKYHTKSVELSDTSTKTTDIGEKTNESE